MSHIEFLKLRLADLVTKVNEYQKLVDSLINLSKIIIIIIFLKKVLMSLGLLCYFLVQHVQLSITSCGVLL